MRTVANQFGFVTSSLAALVDDSTSSSSVALRWEHERNVVGIIRFVYLVTRSDHFIVVILSGDPVQVECFKVKIRTRIHWNKKCVSFGKSSACITYTTSSPAPAWRWWIAWKACRRSSWPQSSVCHSTLWGRLHWQRRLSHRVKVHCSHRALSTESTALWYRSRMWTGQTYYENASKWKRERRLASLAYIVAKFLRDILGGGSRRVTLNGS